jgi:hypothetical protein
MVRKAFILSAVATVFGLMGCADLPAAPAMPNLDVAEAAFRHLFGDTAKPGPARCIAMLSAKGGEQVDPEPTREFLARFADIQPQVKGQSQCVKAADGIGVADKETGKFALIYSVGPAKCTTDTVCEVYAQYYAAPTAAAGWIYRLKKSNGKWAVTSEHMQWIS